MKRYIVLFVLIIAIMGSGCKKMKSWFSKKKTDTSSAYIAKLENQVKEDSLKFNEELNKVKGQSQAVIDSIQNSCGHKKNSGGKYAFYVITGSFRDAKLADHYVKKMNEKGFNNAEIIEANNGFHLVSVKSSNSLGEAASELSNVRNLVAPTSWVYAAR